MAAWFLDSSAVTKLYVAERGSTWVRNLLDPPQVQDVFIARITTVEVAAAFFRRARSGSLSAANAAEAVGALRRDLERTYRVVEFGAEVSELALTLAERHGLRGYDCVQLASALAIQTDRVAVGLSPLELVSADEELNTAARAEGISVVDPNDHP